jgi:hypothetical protein
MIPLLANDQAHPTKTAQRFLVGWSAWLGAFLGIPVFITIYFLPFNFTVF